MTVILDLKPEVEAAAEAEARAQGVAVETYLQTFLEHSLPRPQAEDAEAIRQRRMEILSRLQGKYAGLPGGSEEFSAQKEPVEGVKEQPVHQNAGKGMT